MFVALLFVLCSTSISCREKSTGEKVEDAVEAVGEDIEEGVEEVGEEIEDATDDH
ncbi:hypothetical protein [Abyssalbus ytuae]|uniref:Uncharacterized protein n=1 Tax=Abyssalbus ytuae TaxID=2926907 RepID=A0A9E6ZQK0_9FLAO|nr:hypothetical protein [Abyssalbus ytuae]UOB16078.1 hypothetical protein MQE35_10040 [Abyssalbus ytuae]